MVTGGAGSLGLATAKNLLSNGFEVLVMDLPSASATVSKNLGKNVKFVGGDVTSESDVEGAIKEIQSSFGYLNVLVNCAGISRARQLFNFNRDAIADLEQFQTLLSVNVGGTINTIRFGVQMMAKNQPDEDGLRGLVVNTSGFYAFDGQIGQTVLSAAGGAIASMTLPLCRELAPVGIRVMTIAPGIMDSNLTSFLPKKVCDHIQVFTPSPKRFGDPDEYAHLVMAIIQNKFLNGEVIRLDGGLRTYLM